MFFDFVVEMIYVDGMILYFFLFLNNYYFGNVMFDFYLMVVVSDNGGLVN